MLANLQIAYAHRAPKLVLADARADTLSGPTKNAHMGDANGLLNRTAGLELADELLFLSRGVLQLAERKHDEALRTFDRVLGRRPNNVVALTGRARIYYQRRQYAPALKTFQRVLQLAWGVDSRSTEFFAPETWIAPRSGIGWETLENLNLCNRP